MYEYQTVIQDAVDIHYPILEMLCQSKIRSVELCSLVSETAHGRPGPNEMLIMMIIVMTMMMIAIITMMMMLR